MTKGKIYDMIKNVKTNAEGYRSGHNEAVLKTVCPLGHVGSNPTPSANKANTPVNTGVFLIFTRFLHDFI